MGQMERTHLCLSRKLDWVRCKTNLLAMLYDRVGWYREVDINTPRRMHPKLDADPVVNLGRTDVGLRGWVCYLLDDILPQLYTS